MEWTRITTNICEPGTKLTSYELFLNKNFGNEKRQITVFLSTLDHEFITSRRVFRSTIHFVEYTTIFLWILEMYFIFYVCITRHLLGTACTPALQFFHYWQRNDKHPFRYWMHCYLLAWILCWSYTLILPCNWRTKCAVLNWICRALGPFPMFYSQEFMAIGENICWTEVESAWIVMFTVMTSLTQVY